MANIQPEKSKEKGGQKVATELAGRIDTLEGTINLLKKNLEYVEGANKFILIVLLLGFITMFVAFVTMLILAFNSGASTQAEFIKSTQRIIDALPKK